MSTAAMKDEMKSMSAQLMVKGFTQGEGIDCNETFFPVSCKHSFRIIMASIITEGIPRKDIKEVWYAYEQTHTCSNSQGRQFRETSVSQEPV